jgi:hypothetical protein
MISLSVGGNNTRVENKNDFSSSKCQKLHKNPEVLNERV